MAQRKLIFKISHCCPANSNLEEFEKNLPELLGKIIPPSIFAPRVLPKIKAWKYIKADGTRDDSKVQYAVNVTWDGNTTDYIEISVNDDQVDGDGQLLGELQLSISCENLCRDVKYKAWWQGGGLPLSPFKRPIPCVSGGYNCGTNTFTMGPCAMSGWGLAVGQEVKMFAFGGWGPLRFFKASKPVIGRVKSPSVGLINYRQEVPNMYPQHNDDQSIINNRLQNGYKDVLTEYHFDLEELSNITIKGIKPGTTHLTCTDGVACYWSMAIVVSPSYCAKHGDLGTHPTRKTNLDQPTDTFPAANTIEDKFGQVVRRNEDLSIPYSPSKPETSSNWCNCEATDDLLDAGGAGDKLKFGPEDMTLGGDGEWKVCGSSDNSDQYFSDNGLLINSGNIITDSADQPFVSTSVLFNSAHKSGNIFKLNPVLRHAACYVGQKIKIYVPDDVCKDANGDPIDWDVRIVGNAALVPTGEGGRNNIQFGLDKEAEGSGWTAENPGPGAYTANKDFKFWKIRKKKKGKKPYFTVECLAPTNYLPTTFAVFPETNIVDSLSSLKYSSREQWVESAVLRKKRLMLSVVDSEPAGTVGSGTWALRKHIQFERDGTGNTKGTKWIACTADNVSDTTITHTTGAQLIQIWGFCPPVKWEVKGHTECTFKGGQDKQDWIIPRSTEYGTLDAKVTVDYRDALPAEGAEVVRSEPETKYGWTIKFAIPDVYHKGNEPFGQYALFNDGDYSKPDEVGKDWALKKIKVNDPPKGMAVVGSAVIFAFFKPFSLNQASNIHPYYNEAVTNRGILEDGSKWWWLGDGDKTYSQPFHGPGSLKDPLKKNLKEKWGGVYEQIRGGVCMWSTSEDSKLKMPSLDIKRVFIVDKDGNVKVLKDEQDGKGIVGGGDKPLQADPCA